MKKYIHYCWFGDKPLPKLAKKCIESWKKYLPDFEIIRWNEENVDINECLFIKEAYKNKKWAFVADYARTKALKEMGGIYFDTDMEVTKDISNLVEKGSFLGVEDTGKIACGVWYEEKENGYLSTKLLDKYKSFKTFDLKNIGSYSIPILITEILEKCGFEYNKKDIQVLKHDIYIYPRDYFYPYSYNWENNIFTENTCMIHYYDASWIPIKDRIEIYMLRKIGREKTFTILHCYRKIKDIIRKICKIILFPLVIYKRYKRKKLLIDSKYINRINNTIEQLGKFNSSDYIVIHNKDYFGVTSATYELFDKCVDCGEIYRKIDAQKIAQEISKNNIQQVIFSSLSLGQKMIITELKKVNPDIRVKAFWHGSHSQILDIYGWDRLQEIIQLNKKGIIDKVATCKESLYNFYKSKGIDIYFLTNKVSIDKKNKNANRNKNKNLKIGLYAAKCDDWRKNMFSQMAAVALIPNAVIDMVPLNDTAKEFAKILGVKIEGLEESLPREELINRMGNNDVNLYVTYSECAPMLPLESFEMDVPCILGNNNHYFLNSNLEEIIVVNDENDIEEIKERILNSIKNKTEIINLYKEFRKENLLSSKRQIEEFLRK